MRVERERVRPVQALEGRSSLVAQIEEGAIGAVHVMPEPFDGTQVGDGRQRIDRAGVRRAGARHHRKRKQTRPAIGGNGLRQRRHRQAIALVARQRSHAVGHHAGNLGRLEHRVMRLVRRVDHAPADVGAQVPLSSTQQGVEGGHGAARGEEPARGLGESHPVAQPVERVGLELHQCGCGLPESR